MKYLLVLFALISCTYAFAVSDVESTLRRVTQSLVEQQHADGYWQGIFEADPSHDLYFLLYTKTMIKTLDGKQRRDLLEKLPEIETQTYDRVFDWAGVRRDGWSNSPQGKTDFETTYLIVKSLEHLNFQGRNKNESNILIKAKAFLKSSKRNAESLNIFNKINLSLFGLSSLKKIPQIPMVLFALPKWFPVNIYSIGFPRSFVVPLVVWRYFRERQINNERVRSFNLDIKKSGGAGFRKPFKHLNIFRPWNKVKAIAGLKRLINDLKGKSLDLSSFNFLLRTIENILPIDHQAYAQEALAWLLKRQQKDGTWAGFSMMTMMSSMSLKVAHDLGVDDFKQELYASWRGLYQMRWTGRDGKVIQQTSTSAVMDTARALSAFSYLPLEMKHELLPPKSIEQGLSWLKSKRITVAGDWIEQTPDLPRSAWAFEFYNDYYPDTDDTMMVVDAFTHQNRYQGYKKPLDDAVTWVLGLQRSDGSFAAWDKNNTKLFTPLFRLAFRNAADVGDLGQPDVTSRIMKSLVEIKKKKLYSAAKINQTLQKACRYLMKVRGKQGRNKLPLWRGDWFINYSYGTSEGLEALIKADCIASSEVKKYLTWFQQIQNIDGGFGEAPESYNQQKYVKAPSTEAQTVVVLNLLLGIKESRGSAFYPKLNHMIDNSISFLLKRLEHKDIPRDTFYTATLIKALTYTQYDMFVHYEVIKAFSRYLKLTDL